jgi:hypothetical protein
MRFLIDSCASYLVPTGTLAVIPDGRSGALFSAAHRRRDIDSARTDRLRNLPATMVT